MNKFLSILFLTILLILTQNITASNASFSENNSEDQIEIHKLNQQNNLQKVDVEDEGKNEMDEDDDEVGNRVIAIIPKSTPSASIRQTLGNRSLPTVTPSTKKLSKTRISTDTATPTPIPTVEYVNSKAEYTEERLNFIIELQKLLTSLKKIIFNTLS